MSSTYTYALTDFEQCVCRYGDYDGETFVSYSYGQKKIALCQMYRWRKNSEEDLSTIDSAMYATHNADLPEYITDQETKIEKIKINFSINGYNNSHIMGLHVKIPKSEYSAASNNRALWDIVENGDIADTIYVGQKNDVSVKTAEITNFTQIENFLKYGVALRPTMDAEDWGEIYNDQAVCTGISVEMEFSSAKVPPEISLIAPEAGTNLLITEIAKFEWNYNQSAGILPEKFLLLYNNGETWETLQEFDKNSTNATAYISGIPRISANGVQNISLKIRALMDDGRYYDSDAVDVNVCFVDNFDRSPGDGAIRLVTDVITLAWRTDLADGSPGDVAISGTLTQYQVAYSINGGESWTILFDDVTVISADGQCTYDVAPNSFPVGIVAWKARPVVDGNAIDVYSQSTFVAKTKASTSSISCDGKPRPTISWQSVTQVAYQVRFSDFDSGAIYSAETSYTVPYFYADGTYPVQVRTQASSGEWSKWTEIEYVTISNQKPLGTILLSADARRFTVVVDWETATDFETYILYRNDIPVYIGNGKTYTDIAACGNVKYYVRGIAISEYYVQSNTTALEFLPKTDGLYVFDSNEWYALKTNTSAQTRSYSDSRQVYYKYFAGRSKPISFTSGETTRTVSASYVFRTREEAEALAALSGKMVIFKDRRGGCVIGIVNEISHSNERIFAASLSVTEVDYDEKVKYEV